jgi:23S rRNA (cytidine1920-2'-O)/16S rRNA (cytidine1409-2'-O)-methyltransferase
LELYDPTWNFNFQGRHRIMKKRIDLLLVERGLVESRHRAQALLLGGQVLVQEQKVVKAGQLVDSKADIRILGGCPYASRAGAKLEAALAQFKICVRGRVCADLGASTGGFTDCLLQHGASRVDAFDVGKAQLDWRLRVDPRVVVHDEFNVRDLTPGHLSPETSMVTADLSFISLTKILVPLRDSLRGPNRRSPVDILLLVKPQFEVGKGEVGKGGIVRDSERRLKALKSVAEFALRAGFETVGQIPSPVAGSKGNIEFLLYLQLQPDLSSTA